jgi:hypothetical protein
MKLALVQRLGAPVLALMLAGCAAAAAAASQVPDAEKLVGCISNDVAKQAPVTQIIADCGPEEAQVVVDIVADILLASGMGTTSPYATDPQVQASIKAAPARRASQAAPKK